jgi:hypothetical protein
MTPEEFLKRLRDGIASKTDQVIDDDSLFRDLFQSTEKDVNDVLRAISYRTDSDAIFRSILAQLLSSNITPSASPSATGSGMRGFPGFSNLGINISPGSGSMPAVSFEGTPWSADTNWLDTLASSLSNISSNNPAAPEKSEEEIEVTDSKTIETDGIPDIPQEMLATRIGMDGKPYRLWQQIATTQDGDPIYKMINEDGNFYGEEKTFRKGPNGWFRYDKQGFTYKQQLDELTGKMYEYKFRADGQYIDGSKREISDLNIAVEEAPGEVPEEPTYGFMNVGGRGFRYNNAGEIEEVIPYTETPQTQQQLFQNDLAAAQFNMQQQQIAEQMRQNAATQSLGVADRELAYIKSFNDLVRDPSMTLASINWYRGNEDLGRYGGQGPLGRSQALRNSADSLNQSMRNIYSFQPPPTSPLPTNSGLLAQIAQMTGTGAPTTQDTVTDKITDTLITDTQEVTPPPSPGASPAMSAMLPAGSQWMLNMPASTRSGAPRFAPPPGGTSFKGPVPTEQIQSGFQDIYNNEYLARRREAERRQRELAQARAFQGINNPIGKWSPNSLSGFNNMPQPRRRFNMYD